MSDNTGVRFQRANFVVTDIDRALGFYRDVLGLKLDFVKDSPDDSYSYDVFEIDRAQKIRFAVLSSATQVRVSWRSPNCPAPHFRTCPTHDGPR